MPWYYQLILLGVILVLIALGAGLAFLDIAIERSADKMMAQHKKEPWDDSRRN